jgi:hypothetical protein
MEGNLYQLMSQRDGIPFDTMDIKKISWVVQFGCLLEHCKELIAVCET